jgi:hypothetical protein
MSMNWILDSSVFSTRNNCGIGWTDQLIVLYQLGNTLIALAYFAIPISLSVLYYKIRTLRAFVNFNPTIILMFTLFILLCGITHIAHVVVFWWPAYRLFTVIDLLTGAVSLTTAIILPVVIYDIFKRISENERT